VASAFHYILPRYPRAARRAAAACLLAALRYHFKTLVANYLIPVLALRLLPSAAALSGAALLLLGWRFLLQAWRF